ncbi:MAG: YceI family protein [Anaerolineae bacterium]|nr:YceI family protein [Anaerolineae bacterium]
MAQWNIDPVHATAAFAARHMMVSTVRGDFKNVTGTIDFDPDNPQAGGSVEAVIEVSSMSSTGNEQRDGHLLSADFLDAENHPTITFKSTSVKVDSDGTSAKVTGDLTIRGVTKSVVLDTEFLGRAQSPYGHQVVGFTASTKINREDFGLTWNMALETGGWLVGKDIKIELDLEAVPVEQQELA